MTWLETLVEKLLIQLRRLFVMVQCSTVMGVRLELTTNSISTLNFLETPKFI